MKHSQTVEHIIAVSEDWDGGEELLAIYIPWVPTLLRQDKVIFHTDPGDSLQVATMVRPEGEIIVAHNHPTRERAIRETREVLILREGKMIVSLYDRKRRLEREITMVDGDIIVLTGGYHSIKIVDTSELVEVKQGPYLGSKHDKSIMT